MADNSDGIEIEGIDKYDRVKAQGAQLFTEMMQRRASSTPGEPSVTEGLASSGVEAAPAIPTIITPDQPVEPTTLAVTDSEHREVTMAPNPTSAQESRRQAFSSDQRLPASLQSAVVVPGENGSRQLIDKTTGEVITQLPGTLTYTTKDYDESKKDKYIISSDGKFDALTDPETGNKVAWFPETVDQSAANAAPEIPAGFTPDQVVNFVRFQIARSEGGSQNISPDLISSWATRVDGYNFAGPTVFQWPPGSGTVVNEAEFKDALGMEAEARLILASADFWLNKQVYAQFDAMFSGLQREHFNALKEVLGQEGMNIMAQMEQNQGLYFRLPAGDRRAAMPGEQAYYDNGAIARLVTAGLTSQEAEARLAIVKRLFHTSGMSGFYTGPADAAGNLLEYQFMNQAINLNFANPGGVLLPEIRRLDWGDPRDPGRAAYIQANLRSQPALIFQRNERYHEMKRQYRLQRMEHHQQSSFAVEDTVSVGSLRRLLYLPEELDRLGRALGNGGRAESLRYACETYLVTLPQMNGVQTLGEFLGPHNGRPADTVNYGQTFRYSGYVKNAGEIVNAITDPDQGFINVPIKGGRHAADRERLKDNLSNLFAVLGKYKEAFGKYAPNLLSYSTSRLEGDTFEYFNGRSHDRLHEFAETPRFGRQVQFAVTEALKDLMDEDTFTETLARLNAQEWKIEGTETTVGLGRWMGRIFGAARGKGGGRH